MILLTPELSVRMHGPTGSLLLLTGDYTHRPGRRPRALNECNGDVTTVIGVFPFCAGGLAGTRRKNDTKTTTLSGYLSIQASAIRRMIGGRKHQ